MEGRYLKDYDHDKEVLIWWYISSWSNKDGWMLAKSIADVMMLTNIPLQIYQLEVGQIQCMRKLSYWFGVPYNFKAIERFGRKVG